MAKHLKRQKRKAHRPRCNISGLVIFDTQLDAQIALAGCIRRDSGEIRFFGCGNHFHLTAQEERNAEAS